MTTASTPPTRFRTEIVDLLMTLWENMQDSAMSCVLEFDGHLDEVRLERAMRLTLDAEPILGCRFEERWYRPVWRRRNDLDEIDVLHIRDGDRRAALDRFFTDTLDADRDCQVRGELIRGKTDTLCVKLSHKVGDGQALKQYLALLARTYRTLADNPDHVPRPNPGTDRGLLQVAPEFDEERRREVRRHANENKPSAVNLGRWEPPKQQDAPDYGVLIRHLDANRVASLFKYAVKLRVTMFHLLMGAMFMGLRDVVPYSPDAALPLWSVVDLRRFAAAREDRALCNLFGLIHVALRPDTQQSLSDISVQVRDQLRAKQKRLGLTSPPFNLESNGLARLVVRCVPYRWMKGFVQRRLDRMTAGICMITDIGTMDPERLDFGDIGLSGAYVTSGMVRDSKVLLVCTSQFRDTLTVCSSVPRLQPMRDVLDRMIESLPD